MMADAFFITHKIYSVYRPFQSNNPYKYPYLILGNMKITSNFEICRNSLPLGINPFGWFILK